MTPPLPSLTPRKVIRALRRAGFYLHHSKGAHRAFRHPDNPSLQVTIAYHNKDLKWKTLDSIVKQSGLTHDDFRKFL